MSSLAPGLLYMRENDCPHPSEKTLAARIKKV